MELQKLEDNFVAENIKNFLTEDKFNEFKANLQELASVEFENNEKGRKEARSLSRKVGTLKTKITEKFDELIKAEKEKNDEFVKYLKELTSTKAKYLAECSDMQAIIKRDSDKFDDAIKQRFEDMRANLKQYQTTAELKQAKENLMSFLDFDWAEKHKDSEKVFSEVMDKLIMQEATIAQLEKERAERQRLEAEKQRAEQERIIREQAERLAQGKEIELPASVKPEEVSPTPHTVEQVQPMPTEQYTLFLDTETTNMISSKARIVQLGAIVKDQNGKEVERLNILVKQDAPIPAETIAIHGKTDEMCAEHGVELSEALQRFKDLHDNCDFVVAHDMPYDSTVIACEFKRIGVDFEITKPKRDTMAIYKNIVQCPPTEKMIEANIKGYKAPKLQEAYQFVFGKEFDNAHDAMADITATAELYEHFIKVNKSVVDIIESAGLSRDLARLIAKRLSEADLTNYKHR